MYVMTQSIHLYSSANIKWSNTLTHISVKPFTRPVGPTGIIPSVVKDIFFLFFTSSVIEYIVEQSNKYAAECMGEQYNTWKPITTDELCAYFGFMILMGLVKLPSIYDYWKKDEIYHYSPVADRISRDRFFELHRYLHFTDNSVLSSPGTATYDKLGKVREIINMLSDKFLSLYNPHKELSIDEAMVPFKGRSSLKQYMPKKPIKRGIKIWVRADAQNGYISAFEVYTGKKEGSTEHGLGANVVMSLTEQLHNTHHHVYFDNFFSSVDLLLNLYKRGLYGCGTMRTNRKGFPEALKPTAKKGLKERGNSVTYQKSNLTVSVWQDNKPVVVIATNSDPTTTETVPRKKRDGSVAMYECPASVALYNKHMGGVDHNDQLRGYYHVRLKCRKYYKYIFWFLFDVVVTNSYILCRSNTDMKITTIKDFRTALAKELIGDYCTRKRPGRRSALPPPQRFCQAHFPMRGADRSHRCYYCHNYKHQRHATVWYCRDCQVFLCHNGKTDDCFLQYHTQHGPTYT